MTEDARMVTQALLTALLTVFGGVVLLVLERLVEALTLDPLRELRKAIAEIDTNLNFFANRYTNPVTPEQWNELSDTGREDIKAVANTIRRDATRLIAAANAITGYRLLARLKLVPSRLHIENAFTNLILISNRFIVPPLPLNASASLLYVSHEAADAVRRQLGLHRITSQ
jgi:HAMP domain-containing protein